LGFFGVFFFVIVPTVRHKQDMEETHLVILKIEQPQMNRGRINKITVGIYQSLSGLLLPRHTSCHESGNVSCSLVSCS